MKRKTVKSSVVMYEIWQEEQRELLKRIATLTEKGKIVWKCVKYYPLYFLDRDKLEDLPACLCQTFFLTTTIDGLPYELEVMEKIRIPEGKGDISITLTCKFADDLCQIEEDVSRDLDAYDDCAPEEIALTFKDSPAMMLNTAIIPQIIDNEAVKEAFEWAHFTDYVNASRRLWNHPLVRLGERLFNEQRVHDCHRMVFDTQFREQLLSE